MFVLKVVAYCATVAGAMFLGFWELRLKRHLTDDMTRSVDRFDEFGFVGTLSERMKRERALGGLAKEERVKLRRIVVSKFLLIALLIAEVLFFQR